MDAMPHPGDWMQRHCNLHSAMVRVSLISQLEIKRRLTQLTEHVCRHPEFSQRFLDLLLDLEEDLASCESATGLRSPLLLDGGVSEPNGQQMVVLENVLGIN